MVQTLRVKRLLVAGILLFGASFPASAKFVTSLSDSQIEKVLESYFPLNEYAAFARVSLHKPQVRLQKGSKGVLLIVPVVANVAGGTMHQGHATIQVDLAYKPPTGGLYFNNPAVLQFEMPGVEENMQGKLRKIVESIGQNSLPVVRVYSVKERDLNHSLAKSALKSLLIEDGRIQMEFGFN